MVQGISGRAQKICLPYFNLVLIIGTGEKRKYKEMEERGVTKQATLTMSIQPTLILYLNAP